ncbi:Swi5-dependent recombination DNA repair protein 1 [Madurella fahalii]|uniref:Swi5-dependent recombination DNA repair protein 1 n=1 Tax=Madurella fahalii TaxID=1157608 RepID=A0ABQ0FYF1_9PEZI
MSFQTPGGPAAKRRRVEAANATLRKPFRSPLISRRQQSQVQSSPGFSPEKIQNSPNGGGVASRASAAASAAGVRTPATPAHAGGPRPEPSAAVAASSPLANSNRPNPSLGAVDTGGARNVVLARRHRLTVGDSKPSSPDGSPDGDRDGDGVRDGDANNDPSLLLQRIDASQREMQAHTRAMQKQLELVRQARRIEQQQQQQQQQRDSTSSSRAKRGAGGTADLTELVGKWKEASRLAAEELFELIKSRVEGMGGARAWRESRKRQLWFGGFADGDGDGEAGEVREGEECDEGDEGRNDEEGGEEQVGFTMLMMLKSLNIEPDVLGYDPVEDKWKG